MQQNYWTTRILIVVACLTPCGAWGESIETFTEPYQRIAAAAAETGVIDRILVREGDAVSQKQLLAQLDDRVLQAALEVARAAKDSLGARRNAEVELALRERQLLSYRELNQQGNASPRELERAENEHHQAAARLQSVREDLEVRRLEYERVKTQIQQRRIESPINGFVVAIDRAVGEFVAPTDPVVMHLVELDKLKAVFAVPQAAARNLRAGQTIQLTVGYDEIACDGTIEFVSPVVNPESSSVAVKVRIDNQARAIQSGWVCRWDLGSQTPSSPTARTTTDQRSNLQRR